MPSPSAIDWNDLLPRQVVAVGGVFVAAVAIVGMIVSGSPECMPFALIGLVAAVGGFTVELAPRLREAIGNLLADWRADTATHPATGWQAHLDHPPSLVKASRQPGREPVVHSEGQPDPRLPRQGVIVREPPRKLWNPAAAAVLSVVPGLGHVYKGQGLVGLGWLAVVTAGYSAFVLPGIVLHVMCALDSLAGTPWGTGRISVVRP